MKKLKLDELRVDSFHTSSTEAGARGTVHGHYSVDGTCVLSRGGSCDPTCPDSCAATCQGSCWISCAGNTCDVTCSCD